MTRLLVLFATLAGCTNTGTGVELTVEPGSLVVDSLVIVADYDGRSVSQTVTLGNVPTLTMVAALPDESTSVVFDVTGLDQGHPVGHGVTPSIAVTPHHLSTATVMLSPPAGDGGLPGVDGGTDGGGVLWHRQQGTSPPGPGTITAIWGSSGTDVYASSTLTGNVNVFHYNGSAWIGQLAGSSVGLNGVGGSSATDVFLVGDNATILHGAGAQWSTESAPIPSSINLNAVFAVASGDVFAVGSGNTVVHRVTGGWVDQTAAGSTVLHGVWGVPGKVWAVGSGGVILRSNENGTWSTEPSGTTAELRGIFGSSATDLWVVGDGVVLRSSGNGSWSMDATGVPAGVSLAGVGGRAGGPVWAVGSGWTIVRRDPFTWVVESVDVSVDSASADLLRAVWAPLGAEAFAGGAGQTLLHRP